MSASPTDASLPDRRQHHHRAWFPSLTEFPDSPSVYSHAYPSPDPGALSAGLSDPAADDETIRSLSTEDVQDDSDLDDCTDDASHRISLQGPKIRFHSRAPWETDDVPLAEEPDNSPRSATFGSKLKGTASRADTLIRTFTKGRPSIDSARSRASAASFEVTAGSYSSSRGALHDLARQSISTSSLSSSATSIRNHVSARTNTYPEPSHRVPHGHGSLSRTAVSLDGGLPPPVPLETVPMRPSSSDVTRIGRERSVKLHPVRLSQERPLHHDSFVHPYANPDLVLAYTPSLETIPSQPTLGDMSGSNSTVPVADSTSTRSASFSVISTETSITSLTSRDHVQANPRVNGKEISSPISVLHQNDPNFVGRNTRFLSLHPPPLGFDSPQRSNPRPAPAVTLISLQEAQARERFRTNTVHTTTAPDIPEAAEDQTEEMDPAGSGARERVRSISAGTPQKPVPFAPAQSRITETTEESAILPSTNAVPSRALKHKKSGFMRLFGGRIPEGEKDTSPLPPVPPFADGYVEQSSQVHGTGRSAKLTRLRVTKPSSSPTLRALSNASNALPGGEGSDGKGPSSRRRHPPSLSIVTKSSDHSIATSATVPGSAMGLNFTQQYPLSLTVPQSAPPGNSDFTGLQLRPVSASFSSHFADIVAGALEDSQCDVHTPSSAASSSTALSPFTPVSTRRSDDASATATEIPGEENLTIKGLQDQLASAKEAWWQQIWELREHIRDLTAELEDLRAADYEYCEVCGRGEPPSCRASPLDGQHPKKVGVVNRPRARTGDAARFANGN